MPEQEKKKTNKARHSDQPKRQRYNATNRGYRRRLRDLERHIEKHPRDSVAPEALPKVKALASGGRGK